MKNLKYFSFILFVIITYNLDSQINNAVKKHSNYNYLKTQNTNKVGVLIQIYDPNTDELMESYVSEIVCYWYVIDDVTKLVYHSVDKYGKTIDYVYYAIEKILIDDVTNTFYLNTKNGEKFICTLWKDASLISYTKENEVILWSGEIYY